MTVNEQTLLSCASALSAPHSDAEFKGSWARFHIDLGTADELAFDILINMLVGFSFEVRPLIPCRCPSAPATLLLSSKESFGKAA